MMDGDLDRPSNVWIVHRDTRERQALARLAAAGENTLLGAPGDALFESVPRPDLVVLGVAGDFERELEFAHRTALRLPGCPWLLLVAGDETAEVARLFEGIPCEVLPHPPLANALQRAIREKLGLRGAQSIADRRRRDRLATRFSHWFGDFEEPGLIRALDPKLERLPVLLRGEAGSGRGLLARYVHSFGGSAEHSFVHVTCEGVTESASLLAQLGDAPARSTVFLDEVDALSLALQRQLRDWIELGLPGRFASAEPVRWMASAGEEVARTLGRSLDPQLEQALSVLPIHVPALRDRPDAAVSLAEQTAREWHLTSGLEVRRFAPDALATVRTHPWPGNLRELEAVLVRTLTETRSDPVTAEQLRFDVVGEWGRAAPARAPVEARQETVAKRSEELPPPTPLEPVPPAVPDEPSFDPEALALEQLGEASPVDPAPRVKAIDIAAMLDGLLDELRDRIQSRRLLVLKELDRAEPFVLGDADSLRRAFSGLLAQALASVPDRGDMYLASSHHPAGLGGKPSARVLLRYRKPDPERPRSFDPAAALGTSDEDALAEAEAIVVAQGGVFTGDTADARENVIVIDLPAPGPSPER